MNQIETATSDSKMDCRIFGTKARAYKEKQTIMWGAIWDGAQTTEKVL